MVDMSEFDEFQQADDFESNPMTANKKHFESAKLNDPYADMVLDWYKRVESKEMTPIKYGALAAIPGSILVFSLFISNTTANLIGFSAFVISIGFVVFSIWLLGNILDNNAGTKAMQDIADPIREGSEGFFMT